ncbi:MAG: WecB/TagA/CpsF family glycosyltransferase [Geobacteraceae bacterium]
MTSRQLQYVQFRGVKINNTNYRNVHNTIKHLIESDGKGYVCLTDVGNTIRATLDPTFRENLNSSLFSLADGMPLAWYTKLVGGKDIERISGMDLMIKLIAENDGYKHFLLGDTEQRINKVIEKAREINADIQISGYSPPFKEFDDEDNLQMIEMLNSENPDIIWVSFGGGKQEKWMHDNLPMLKRGVMIGAGAAFKWLIGELKTPPKIIQNLGLQWVSRNLQRLVHEPRKNRKSFLWILKWKMMFVMYFPGEVIRNRRRYKKEMV